MNFPPTVAQQITLARWLFPTLKAMPVDGEVYLLKVGNPSRILCRFDPFDKHACCVKAIKVLEERGMTEDLLHRLGWKKGVPVSPLEALKTSPSTIAYAMLDMHADLKNKPKAIE